MPLTVFARDTLLRAISSGDPAPSRAVTAPSTMSEAERAAYARGATETLAGATYQLTPEGVQVTVGDDERGIILALSFADVLDLHVDDSPAFYAEMATKRREIADECDRVSRLSGSAPSGLPS
jgi:hypothetical protein